MGISKHKEQLAIKELFEVQSEQSQDMVALVHGGINITYQELNNKSNQIANYLQKIVKHPCPKIAICMYPSVEMVMCMLAVIKIYGAYVPLDPEYPKEFLQDILNDSDVCIIITDSAHSSELFNKLINIINIKDCWKAILNEKACNLPIKLGAENLPLHVLYTSGSTGKPKGVLNQQLGTINRLSWMWKTYPFEKHEVCAISSSINFVPSVWQIFGPLLKGIKSVILSKMVTKDPNLLLSNLKLYQIIRYMSVPSMLNMVLDYIPKSIVPKIKFWLLSGELTTSELVRKFKSTFGECKLVIIYGSTEGEDITSEEIDFSNFIDESISVGFPIPNVKVYVLDENLQAVQADTIGEIYVTGLGIALGYYNNSSLTAEKFIANPFITQQELKQRRNLRLYKTGDIGKYLGNGKIQLIGRSDNQVKVRGFRVELEQIENVLIKFDKIQSAIVSLHEDINQKKLVACLVIKSACNISEVHSFLASKLPEYMLPDAYIIVDAFPLKPNGKIDRKALTLRRDYQFVRSEYKAPKIKLEADMAQLWSEVLGIDFISVNDNFFYLGGDSLSAIRLLSKIQIFLGTTVSLRILFDNPILKDFCESLKILPRRDSGILLSKSQEGVKNFPLSSFQESLWVLHKFLPDDNSYNICEAIELKGKLVLEGVKYSIQQVIRRQESLRTYFYENDDGKVFQRIKSDLDNVLEVIDFRKRSQEEIYNKVKQIASYPFDLSKAPLFKCYLMNIEKDEYVFIFIIHHIIFDAWSLEILIKELNAFYNLYFLNSKVNLPSISFRYKDFAVLQREWLRGLDFQNDLKFWQKLLKERPQLINLKSNNEKKQRPYKGCVYKFEIPNDLYVKLNELSRDYNCSLYMVLLSCFFLLLYLYSRQKDMVIGMPVSNRYDERLTNLVGFFVNTLPVRIKLDDEMTFLSLLSNVRMKVLEIYEHSKTPFQYLVKHLNFSREDFNNPLFEILFILENYNSEKKLFGLDTNYLSPIIDNAKFDLILTIKQVENSLTGYLEYNTQIFNHSFIKQFADSFNKLISDILQSPQVLVKELSINNDKKVKISHLESKEIDIMQLFFDCASKFEDRVAVIYGDRQITYGELNQRSNQLAKYLKKQGVGSEVLVGIASKRSIEMLIGMLGVLKAGGGYVPLDLKHPEQRLRYMIEDSGISLILLDNETKKTFTWFKGNFIEIDNQKKWKQAVSLEINESVKADNIAYIIYTSGSTGKPKGVMVSRRNLLNCVLATADAIDVKSSKCFIAVTSTNFDVAVLDYFLPLAFGLSIVIANDCERLDPILLYALLQKHPLFCIQATPSLFKTLIRDDLNINDLKNKKVLLAGENIPKKLIQSLSISEPVFNIYGPTEATIYASYYQFEDYRVSIGKSLNGVDLYILDDGMKKVPEGIIGEIYIGGKGVSRGYVNQGGMTAEKFLANPFISSDEAKAAKNLRLYKTGDIGRYLPDGNIEYLGRKDDQVKIRGYRIELGEIERVAESHEWVERAICIARDRKEDDKDICLYLLFKKGEVEKREEVSEGNILFGKEIICAVNEVRDYLSRHLASYMIPNKFIAIKKLPLTINGKVDKGKLPWTEKIITNDVYQGARDNLEKRLQEIWQEVFGLKKVSINDNFFHLGGDSIISIQLVARAKANNIKIQANDIFKHKTIANLSKIATIDQAAKKGSPILSGEFDLSAIQKWFFEQDWSKNLYHQAILLDCDHRVSKELIKETLKELMKHHDMLRSKYVKKGREWKQQNIKQIKYEYREEDLSHVGSEDLLYEIEKRADLVHESLDIQEGKLLGAILYDCGENKKQKLLLIIHHLVVDSVSWRIIKEDIERIYSQLARGKKVKLDPKSSSYQEWVKKIEEYAYSSELEKEIEYWHSIEKRKNNVVKILKYKASVVKIELNEEESGKLIKEVNEAYNTEINDILLTSLILTLSEWRGDKEIVVDIEGHGREDILDGIDLSRTVGWFTSIYPAYLKLSSEQDLGITIRGVKEALRSIPKKGIGYGILKYVKGEKLIEHSEICFNYFGQWKEEKGKIFNYGEEWIGRKVDKENMSKYGLEINSELRKGKLAVEISSNGENNKESVKRFGKLYKRNLSKLIEHCCKMDSYGYSPSDFKLIDFDSSVITEIEKIISENEN